MSLASLPQMHLDYDEYGPNGRGGYGFSVEATSPGHKPAEGGVHHLLYNLVNDEWAHSAEGQREIERTTFKRTVENPHLAERVLRWLAEYDFAGQHLVMFPQRYVSNLPAEAPRPGFGYPGTERWVWYMACIEHLYCPLLQGSCFLTLCQAGPNEPGWNPVLALDLMQMTATDLLRGHLFPQNPQAARN